MTVVGTVLLVDDDLAGLRSHAEILHGRPGLRVLTACSAPEALEAARHHRPDLVLADRLALAEAIRAEPGLEGTLIVLVTGEGEAQLTPEDRGVLDDVLFEPVDPPALIGKVAAMLRLKRLHDQLRADKGELERLHQVVAERLDQVLNLLVHLVDLRVAGAAARGAETAAVAAAVADRFEVPMVLRRDLDIAARIHEIGKVVLDAEPTAEEGPEDLLEGDHWRYVVAARELLERTDGLETAAELIGRIFENWDGTGHPDRLRQGQIPLRSRILRLAIDYRARLERGESAAAAVEQLSQRAGTWYDPLAVAYLEAIAPAVPAAAATGGGRVRVAVSQLVEGMLLADDLHTSGGVKLLAKGARITRTNLEAILRRHRSDPIVHGVWVERPDGGLSVDAASA